MQKNNQYRINGKIFKFISGYDSPYGFITIFQSTTGEKIVIEEQSPQQIADEKKAYDLE